MEILSNIAPARVFYYFEKICSIPHGSGNTKQISEFCANVAKKLKLNYRTDEFNNVIIKKKASAGYENHPPVILQGHLDMVCEKDNSCDLDLTKDGLTLCVEDDVIFAKGTTLGGDDGIAVAMALAILEDNSLCHPPLEVIFTTDEETGMYGAEGIDTSDIFSKTLINIDSEEEGVLTVGCAGGARTEILIPLSTEKSDKKQYLITVEGLRGGHSGIDINKGRYNANILIGKLLEHLPSDIRIAGIRGGSKDNVIPPLSECIIASDTDPTENVNHFINLYKTKSEPDLSITVKETYSDNSVFDKESTKRIISFLCNVKNGVVCMNKELKDLVQTSLNLGILYSDSNSLHASFAVRSSLNEQREQLISDLEYFAKSLGGGASSYGRYPAWEYKKDSYLQSTMKDKFKQLFGKEPRIEVIHAGLECGLFCDKIKNLDAVSIGPDITDIHTTNEKLHITSTQRTYKYLIEVLKEL